MSRRRARSPAKCGRCRQPIVWKRWAHNGTWRGFQPRPGQPFEVRRGQVAVPVEGKTAWRFQHLVDELMARHRCSSTEAEDEARDMTWLVPHACPQPDDPADPADQPADPNGDLTR